MRTSIDDAHGGDPGAFPADAAPHLGHLDHPGVRHCETGLIKRCNDAEAIGNSAAATVAHPRITA